MCYYIYLSSSHPLPTSSWRPDDPSVFVEELLPRYTVNRFFSGPYKYYVGSSSGCGCGFDAPGDAAVLDHLINSAVRSGATLELLQSRIAYEVLPDPEITEHEVLETRAKAEHVSLQRGQSWRDSNVELRIISD